MLRVIEFGLLGVSLVVIIGLIVSGMRDHSNSSGTHSSTAHDDQHGKTM
ncbi:MAG TPA: hypothetical protein VGT04_14845 [Acidobacteriaceae bacterium]|nr:hypothetical protein [Acidobacteriaceae bacterium]